MTFLEACRAWIANHGHLPVDLTLLFEGEEEVGSPNVAAFLKQHQQELTADFALICDTSLWKPGIPSTDNQLTEDYSQKRLSSIPQTVTYTQVCTEAFFLILSSS